MLQFYRKLCFGCLLLVSFALTSCHDPGEFCFLQLGLLPYGTWKTEVLAGSGEVGWLDGDASDAKFNQPFSLALDSSGNLYVADKGNNRIRKVDPTGTVSTLVDASTLGSTGCPPSGLVSPTALTLDERNNQLYFTNGEEVMRLHFQPCSIVSVAKLDSTSPTYDALGLVLGKKGELYFTKSSRNQVFVVRGKDATVFSGTGKAGFNSLPYFEGDFEMPRAISSKEAQFNFPAGLAIDSKGQLWVADLNNHALRTIDTTTGIVRVLRYRSVVDYMRSTSFTVYTQPRLNYPSGIALDASDTVFVSSLATITRIPYGTPTRSGGYGKIRRIERGDETIKRPGTESWLDGENLPDFPWQKNKLYAYGIAVDASGDHLYLANPNTNQIYKLSILDRSLTSIGKPFCL